MMRRSALGHRIATLLALAALLGAPGVAHADAEAGLEWEHLRQHVQMQPHEEQVTVAFAFRNAGDDAVTIRSIQTPCGCTSASIDRGTVEPGEAAQLDVTFTPGHRLGEQVRRITVRSDDPVQPRRTVTLRVDVPEVLDIERRVLRWREANAGQAQTIALTLLTDEPARALRLVEPPDEGEQQQAEEADDHAQPEPVVVFNGAAEVLPQGDEASRYELDLTPQVKQFGPLAATLEPRDPGRVYALTVVPDTRSDERVGQVHLELELADGNTRRFNVLARLPRTAAPAVEPATEPVAAGDAAQR